MLPVRAMILFLFINCSVGTAVAADTDPDPARFADAIRAFEEWDSKNATPADPILFVGSSSIRMWATATAFPGEPVINRGFGGSELSDVIHYYDRVIRPYPAKRIFLYAGDNDIGRGKSVAKVVNDFRTLVSMVQKDFPDTMLYFISIKPSLRRWEHWNTMQEANRRIRELTERDPMLGYVDLAAPLLDANGDPLDVFIEDGLHLNSRGYALWNEAMAPYLDQG